MHRCFLVLFIPFIVLATGITTQPLGRPTGVVEPVNVYPYLRADISHSVEQPELKEYFDALSADSIKTVLLPGESVYIRVDAFSDIVEAVDTRDTLPYNCYDAINASPKWLQDDLYQSFRHLPSDRASELADVILSVPDEQIDEVAFCVAHMSPQSLTDERFDPELLSVNSQWIYRIADSLQYVRLVEYDSDDDWHTTTEYNVVSADLSDTSTLEIPRDIYYWYIVHPKLSDEAPKMRDGSYDSREMTFDYFWREFLWSDPSSSHSYTAGGYPLLADWMKMAKVMWIRNDTVLASDRTIDSTCSALDILGGWVSTIMPDPPGSIRPIQPNQIAIAHYGNCGEVSDLLAGAGRTALLPINCLGTYLQDHVWNEFWDDSFPGELWTEDVWHCYQVDRWGGVTSLAPSWGGYDSDRGGSKNINNALTWRGDGYMPDRTPAYTYVCTLIVEVLDVYGNPVPGAEVLFASNSYYDTSGLFFADLRTTDQNGRVVVSMGDNCPYYFRVDSPVGNYPVDAGIVTTFPILGDGYSAIGETYIASVDLSGALSNFPITELTSTSGPREIQVHFSALDEYIRGPAAFDSQNGTYSYKSPDGRMTVFVCDSANFVQYVSGAAFDGYEYNSRADSGSFTIELPTRDVWYVVASNEEWLTDDELISIDVELNVSPAVDESQKPENIYLAISPNPFNSACKITAPANAEITIHNVQGNTVFKTNYPTGTTSNTEKIREIVWKPDENVPSGIYIVNISAKNELAISRRIVFLK
ncbi:hypothetical protein DRQ29_05790 [bacterium]|nr:MAG: hypothetical protein DRQ29_05790 [bacterium]